MTTHFHPLQILSALAVLVGSALAQDFSNAKLTPPFALTHNARLVNCTIDGEDSPSNQIQVDGDGVTFDGCKFLRCPGSAIRLHGRASNCRVTNCTFEGSQALNTQDRWQGTGVIFQGNIVRIPSGVEGLLIDQPGVGAIDPETGKATGKQTTYSGVVIANNTFECEENAKRGIGLARCVSVIVIGNTFRGAKGVEDLLHFEDRASKLLVTGNLFDLAGALHGIDGSNGGDEAYAQKDRVPRNCVFTNNTLWCQQATGFHLQGTEALGPFVRMTITGNAIHDAAVGVDAFLEKSTLSGNTYYSCKIDERVR